MNEKEFLNQLINEYEDHVKDLKECVEELSKEGTYDRDQQRFQEGYFSAYEEILQDLEIKMRDE